MILIKLKSLLEKFEKNWKFLKKFEIMLKTFIEISANVILKYIKIILKFKFKLI